jgi:hypothetical protein
MLEVEERMYLHVFTLQLVACANVSFIAVMLVDATYCGYTKEGN